MLSQRGNIRERHVVLRAGQRIGQARAVQIEWDRHAVAQVPLSPPQFIELGIAVPSMREASPAAKKLSACAVRRIRRLTDQGA